MFTLSVAVAAAAPLINELLPNPVGADAGHEWIELYNPDPQPVSLLGWSIQAGTSALSERVAFGAVTLPGHGRLVIAESLVPGADLYLGPGQLLALGNAGTSDSAVRLLDADGAVVDTVIYGPGISNGVQGDNGSAPSIVPPAPAAGEALARSPDGHDSDAASDWVLTAAPTPGLPNPGETAPAQGPSCTPAEAASVRINELLPDPHGPDAGREWVELLTGSAEVELGGWRLEAGTSSYDTASTLPAGLVVPASTYVVVGTAPLPEVDVVAAGLQLGNGANADAVRLLDCHGAVADVLVYGTGGDDGWLDEHGLPSSQAPRPASGQSLARLPDGADTDDSAHDLTPADPTPGLPNDAPSPHCGAAGVLINELLADPVGPDAGHEWVELLHTGEGVVSLLGWELQTATRDRWHTAHRFGPTAGLAPGGRLVIGGEAVGQATHLLTGSLGNGAGGDGVRLVDCAGQVVDAVVYGDTNTDQLPDRHAAPATSLAPAPTAGIALARVPDGADTGQPALDFRSSSPTPGVRNTPSDADRGCPSAGAPVVINELLPDPEGPDAGREWIELLSLAASAIDLQGWSLLAGSSEPLAELHRFDGPTPIEPGRWWVLGGPEVPEAAVHSSLSLPNGASQGVAVRLVDCAGEVVDSVLYGDPSAAPLRDDRGREAPPYAQPRAGLAVLRARDGHDTDAAEDWRAGWPSPGAPNPSDGGMGLARLEGCDDGRRAAAPRGETPRACRTGGMDRAPLLLLALACATGRRRPRAHRRPLAGSGRVAALPRRWRHDGDVGHPHRTPPDPRDGRSRGRTR